MRVPHTFFVLVPFAILTLSSCTQPAPPAPILLYNGTGTSPNDVAAIESILGEHRLAYATSDSIALNAMSRNQLMRHRLLIVPGGNYIEMGEALTPGAARNIHEAVGGGLNYLGICAGALLAGAAPTNNFNLTSGVRFDFYAAVKDNVHKAAIPISAPDGTTLDQYWEDGPHLTGWGEPVAKYADGTAAVAQGASGKGWVILCGIHPEAPESWREGMTFATPTGVDNAYAATLIDAALNRESLPHY